MANLISRRVAPYFTTIRPCRLNNLVNVCWSSLVRKPCFWRRIFVCTQHCPVAAMPFFRDFKLCRNLTQHLWHSICLLRNTNAVTRNSRLMSLYLCWLNTLDTAGALTVATSSVQLFSLLLTSIFIKADTYIHIHTYLPTYLPTYLRYWCSVGGFFSSIELSYKSTLKLIL